MAIPKFLVMAIGLIATAQVKGKFQPSNTSRQINYLLQEKDYIITLADDTVYCTIANKARPRFVGRQQRNIKRTISLRCDPHFLWLAI